MIDQPDLLTHHNYNKPLELPNATATLVLGIVSIIGSCCFGIVGIICGTIGLVLANKDSQLYFENPDFYSKSSYQVLNAGKVCSIIGLSLGGLFFISIIIGNISDYLN